MYVIAEIANAAQGLVQGNYDLVDAAKEAGAHAVKFQFYKYDSLCLPSYPKYSIYQDTFYSEKDRKDFVIYAKSVGLDVWVDVFDRWGSALASDLTQWIHCIKIPPTVLLDKQLVNQVRELGVSICLGVGGHEDIVINNMIQFTLPELLLYGFQSFPTQIEDLSLARIAYLKNTFNMPIGFADHTDAVLPIAKRIPVYAYAMGAEVIEKHIIMERQADAIDSSAALEPYEFKEMMLELQQCHDAMGSTNLTPAEKSYLDHAVRMTTVRNMKKGEYVGVRDVQPRRVGNTDALMPGDICLPAVTLRDLSKDTEVIEGDMQSVKTGIAVVCRLHSKRLPYKALLSIGPRSIVDQCLINCIDSVANEVVLATSVNTQDDPLEEISGVEVFRGDEVDVAQRMLDVADTHDWDVILRVTGDSPFISTELMDLLIESHISNDADYSYLENACLGTKCEAMSVSSLRDVIRLFDSSKSEYLTYYFKNNESIFKTNPVVVPAELSGDYRLNVDYPKDYSLAKAIWSIAGFDRRSIPLKEVLSIVKDNDLHKINADCKPSYLSAKMQAEITKATTHEN